MKNTPFSVTLIDHTTIQAKIRDTAEYLSSNYDLSNSVFICVMNGAFMFFSDLVKRLPDSITVDFVRVSSYGATKTSGLLRLLYTHDVRLFNKDVFIVDDILDSGSTIKFLTEKCVADGAKSVHSISLLNRKTSIQLPNHISLFEISDEWVYGYGMDLYGFHRNIPNIMYVEQNID